MRIHIHPAGKSVGQGPSDAAQVEGNENGKYEGSPPEGGQVNRLGVEYSDDDHGPDVIDDGQADKKDGQGLGDATTQQHQGAHTEGDVGGHGDSPAPGEFARLVRERVKECRRQHPAQRSQNGKEGFSRLGELPDPEFPLDLKADNEKEKNHDPFVDQVEPGHLQGRPADPEGDRGVSQVQVGVAKGELASATATTDVASRIVPLVVCRWMNS